MARLLPAQSWLLLVGESGLERVRGDLGVPFLARREYGQDPDAAAVRPAPEVENYLQ